LVDTPDPTEPIDPTDPSYPMDPTDHNAPTDPSDPPDPLDPSEPTDMEIGPRVLKVYFSTAGTDWEAVNREALRVRRQPLLILLPFSALPTTPTLHALDSYHKFLPSPIP
jgi:hypothetical protein